MRGIWFCWLTYLLISLGFWNCQERTKRLQTAETLTSTVGDKVLQVAFIPKGSSIYWKIIHTGALKAAEELGVDLIWQDPIREDNHQLQAQVVQNVIDREIDALILAPVNGTSLIPSAKMVASKNIPLIIVDSELSSPDYTTYIGTDNFEFGKECAKEMARIMKGTGELMMLRYEKGHLSTSQREEGFIAGIKQYAPQINIINDTYGSVSVVKAQAAAEEFLLKHQDIKGVFASNVVGSEAMLDALKNTGRLGKVNFVGVDTSERLLAAMKKGQVHALGIQEPINMGYMSVKMAVEAANNKPGPKRVKTKVYIATKDNMNRPDMANLLNPDLELVANQEKIEAGL